MPADQIISRHQAGEEPYCAWSQYPPDNQKEQQTRMETYASDEVNNDLSDLVRSIVVVYLSVVADLIGCLEI